MDKKKRRKGTVIIGRGAATIRIYPITRKDGYLQNTLCWKEGGRRRTRSFACMEEAKMIAQQISVRLANGWSLGDEVTCRNIVTMFGFAKRQGYLHPDRKTAAEQSETFKAQETEIEIFTPEEMGRLLLASHVRILPLVAIGGFAGIRSAEIKRLDWEDIKWDRGHIEIAGRKAKTAARRLVPLSDNLKAWLAPWREATGPIVPISDTPGALGDVAVKAQIPGGWRQNALRHSFISYRVAETGDVPRTALEAGNSPKMIFRHYREVVTGDEAKAWFNIMPPAVWPPQEWRLMFRTKPQDVAA
jgi:hypothetical protein